MLPYCYRGESSCHATRRYLGAEGDLYLHRCDITIIALKVTVMTPPVHFRPAIRMVLIFSLPKETRARNVLSKRTGTLGIRPSLPLSQETTCNWCEVRMKWDLVSRGTSRLYTRICVTTMADIEPNPFRNLADLTLERVASQFQRDARRVSVSTDNSSSASLEELD